MPQVNPGLLMLIGILIAAPTSIYIILVFDAKKRGVVKKKNIAKINKNFSFYYDNFLSRKQFRKVVDQISALSVYDPLEIKINSVKFYQTTTAITFVTCMGGIIVCRDLIASIAIATFALVMQTVLINQRIDALKFVVVKEISEALSSLMDKYIILQNIPDAVNAAERGPHLSKVFEQIYIILTANDGAKKLDEFYEITPFRSLRTLASISYVLADEGDQDTKDGPAYIQVVQLIKDEADAEIRKLTRTRIAFGKLEYLPLVPVFFIGFLQSFFVSAIPATSIMYNGLLGYLGRFAVVLAAFVGYYYITTIVSPSAVRIHDRSETIDWLLSFRLFEKFIKNVSPKKERIKDAVEQKLKGALSSKDVTYIYASKVLFSSIGLIFSLFALIAITEFSKEYAYNNVNTLSFSGGTQLTEGQTVALRASDAKILALPFVPDDLTIKDYITQAVPEMSEFDKLEQIERVKKKYTTYHNLGYHWYYVLISYAVAVGCWFIPELLIKMRTKLVIAEAVEDVMQMQNIITMLMYTKSDTLDVLYWLEKNSVIHKDALLFAYHEYPSDPEKAIERLKSKSTVPEFLSICDKLLTTVHQISLQEAFRSLISRKNNIMKIQEMYQEASIKKKRRIASPFALAPLILLAALLLLAPLGILGYEQFVKTFKEAGVL